MPNNITLKNYVYIYYRDEVELSMIKDLKTIINNNRSELNGKIDVANSIIISNNEI
jgi:hypothetical protein